MSGLDVTAVLHTSEEKWLALNEMFACVLWDANMNCTFILYFMGSNYLTLKNCSCRTCDIFLHAVG